MKNKSRGMILAFSILSLFVVSAMTPIIGYDVRTTDEDMMDEKHDFVRCFHSELSNYACNSEAVSLLKETVEPVLIEKEVSSPTTTSDGLMDSAWPMKCHDLHHTGRSPYSTANNPYTEKWKFHCDRIDGSPVIGSDGAIYFGDFDDYLYALYPNGTLKWSYETDMWIWSAPAISEDGTIYVGSCDFYLHAVYPNGTMKWRFNAEDAISTSPAIGNDGSIYFGTMGDGYRIYAVNPNGTEKWHYNTGYKITSDPAIGNDGTIYIGSGDNYLYAIYPNGTLRWRFPTGHYVKGPPSIADDGTIYFGSWDDYLYALYPNGTMKWRHEVGAGTESNPSIGEDGTIYVGGGYLYAIYPNGTRKWTFDFGDNIHSHQSSPAISSDGTIYIGTHIGDDDGGEIIAVNPDGTERWRKTIATNHVDSSPCIGEDGTIYIGSSSDEQGYSYGYLYAFGENNVNDPPSKPIITGETNGKFGESYDYTFVAIDPEEDDVWYYIDWGDDQVEEWFGPFASGEEVVVSHTWDEQDTYLIKAKAKDIFDAESDWGELEVTMPINQQSSNSLFLRFLDRFPNAFPILRSLFGL